MICLPENMYGDKGLSDFPCYSDKYGTNRALAKEKGLKLKLLCTKVRRCQIFLVLLLNYAGLIN